LQLQTRLRSGAVADQNDRIVLRPIRHETLARETPALVIVDGAQGLDTALAVLWSDVAVQRCTVHKHRNLLAHAPERLHEEISNDYKDMIYADSKQEIETKRKAFIRKWHLKCKVYVLTPHLISSTHIANIHC